ncbi:MAG: hypothetical protein JNJ61_09765 [Anaerolineae bacterium]|nr:hypothetical protein [Anaerolineae bacterium]
MTVHRCPLLETPARYECSLTNYPWSRVTYILEGRAGSPFVQIVLPSRSAPTGG